METTASKYYYFDKFTRKNMKYIRCSRCLKGPFKQHEADQVGAYGNGTTPLYYCDSCAGNLGFSKEDKINPLDLIEEPTEKQLGDDSIKKIIDDAEKISKITIEDGKEVMKKNQKKDKEEVYVYVVKCLDKTFFHGVTIDVEKNLKYINQGSGNSYTRPKTRRPVELIFSQKVVGRESAKKLKSELLKRFRNPTN